jgi:hypothetical protein
MNSLQRGMGDIARSSTHRELAFATTTSKAKAVQVAQSIRSNLVEVHVLGHTSRTTDTKVENLKIGKAVDKDARRYKATCEVVITPVATTTYYLVVLISKRDMRRKVEKAVGQALRWVPREDIASMEPGPAEEGTEDEVEQF